jgi:hypothetical protein
LPFTGQLCVCIRKKWDTSQEDRKSHRGGAEDAE